MRRQSQAKATQLETSVYVRRMGQGVGWPWCVPWLLLPRQARGRVAYSTGSRKDDSSVRSRQAGQSDPATAGSVDARETRQQCSGDGQWAALRWMGARRELTVAEGA